MLLEILGLVIISFFAFLYIVAPLLVKMNYRQKQSPELKSLNLSSAPKEAKEYFIKTEGELAALGFKPGGNWVLDDFAPNVKTYILLMMEPTSGIAVAASPVFQIVGNQEKFNMAFVEFVTFFTDNSSLCTNNCADPGVAPLPPEKRVMYLPTIGDNVEKLLEVHKMRQFQLQPSPQVLRCRNEEQLADSFRRSLIETGDYFAKLGYMTLDQGDFHYRLTFKGAYVFSWKNLWPILQARRFQLKAKSRRFLATGKPQEVQGETDFSDYLG